VFTLVWVLQAQTVVADNLGLAVAVCINRFCHYHPRCDILPSSAVDKNRRFCNLVHMHLSILISDIFVLQHLESLQLDFLTVSVWIGGRLGRILPLAMFPVLALAELFAIRQQLQAVHLQTLNKERLEIIVNQWVRDSTVPTFEDVSKVECAGLLSPYSGNNISPSFFFNWLLPQGGF
jgi:hypothetical protein